MYKKYLIVVILLIFSFTLYSCAGPGAKSASSSGDLAYGSIKFSMPLTAGKYISAGRSTVRITLTGDGLSSASINTYNYAAVITVSNIPAGNKTAKIEILDANNVLLAERIFSLFVKAGATITASATLGVTATDTAFSPQIIEIPTGTTLVWINNGNSAHRLIRSNGVNLGTMQSGESISVTFTTDETVTYFLDSLSSGISGTILVTTTPSITSVSPAYASVGDIITITGTGFGGIQHNNTVTFGSTRATNIISWSNTQIVTTVPAGMTTGGVFISVNYVTSASSAFRLEPPVFAWTSGSYGAAAGQLKHPQGMFVDAATGRLYVCEDGGDGDRNDRISVFQSSNGSFVTTYGSTGVGNGQFQGPGSIAQDPIGNFYVTDTQNNRIQKFNNNFEFITKWGTPGAGDGQLNQPQGICIATPMNVIYVADAANNRIQRFDPDGNFELKWGSLGDGDGQFTYPFMLAFGNFKIYVTDFANDRIQVFNIGGVFITKWGSTGTGNGQFMGPAGIAVDSNGDIYVSDSGNNRVQKFTEDGVFITKWGSVGTGTANFTGINGITVDSNLNIYTSEDHLSTDRIKKYTYIQ